MKRKLLFAVLALMTSLSVSAWDGSEGKVYLQNVGSGLFWGAGQNWGTRASLLPHAETVTLHLADGKYTIESQVNNGGTAYYFNGDYMDNGSPVSLTITEVETGVYTIANGDSYFGYDDATINPITGVVLGKGVASDTDNGKWRIYTEAEMLATLDAATLENGVDATFLIKDHSFGRNYRWRSDAWTMVASNQNLSGGNNDNNCAESYHSNFTLSQVLNGVPNGEYELKAQGFYRQDGSDNTHLPVFYINDGTATFSLKTGGENSMSDASNSFSAGSYTIDPIRVTVGDGKITLGAKLEGNTNLWCIFDNFTLTFYGIDLSAYEAQIETLRSTLTSLEAQPMNATVLATANTALSETASVAHNQAAMEAAIIQLNSAIEAANASIANYAAAKAYLDACNTLDAAGQASYAANETVVAVQTAYDNRTLEALTDEQKSAMDAAVLVAVRVQTTAGSDWTLALVNPGFELGNVNGWSNSGTESAAAQGNKAFDNTQGNYYAERWHADGTVDLNQTVTDLPSGVYEIGAYLFTDTNTGILYANDIQTSFKTSGWYTVQVAVDDNGSIKFGAGCTLTASTWICMDGFKLTLVSAGLPDVTAVTGKMNADVAAAQTTAIETYNGERTVANYNAAVAAIATAQASIDAYTAAVAAIEKANAIKAAHNFASVAATNTFADAIAEIQSGYDENTLTTDQANAAATTLGVAVTGWHGGNNNAAAVYLRDGFALGDFAADPALHVNTWSTEGDNDGTGFSVPFYESWTGDTNSLPESTLTGTLTGLPNGLYSITAWVRVRAKNNVAAADATGITMDVNGGEAVDVTEGDKIGESQFQMKTYTAQNLVKDGNLTLNFNITDTNISWLSFKNVKYTKVRDLTPEEAFVAATEEDYAALNAAIEGKVLGFEAGEYAPYNNVAGVAAIAAAKAIDQTAQNSQEDVQAATAAITNATWTANAAEVNAVYDGSFEADYSGQSGNINPTGWQRVKGAAADGYNVRLMNGTNAGLAATTSGKALFTKQSAYYGYANGYTMPLKANTMYKVTFVYGGWGDCKKDGYVSMAAPDGSAVTLSATDLPVDATNADADVNAWKSYEAFFQTGEAGDYVLGLRKKNNDTSGQSQYVYGDIVLVKATAADFKDALEAEIATANAVDVTTNVGEGVFQIPASAASALTTAISDAQLVYNNADATIDEVLNATESVKAAVETYKDPELNAPVEGKVYNIVNVSEGYNHANKAVTFKSASDADLSGNTTSFGYNEAPGSIYPQGFKFTAVDGTKNGYKLSYTRADGNEVYVGTGSSTGLGNNNDQIRPTTDDTKAVTIKVVATSTENVWNLYNTLASKNIGANGANDQGFYTVATYNSMKIQEAVENEVSLNIAATNQYGTIILPFNAAVPAGVTAYSVAKTEGSTLTLVEENAFVANTPYIVFAESGATETLSGLGSAYTDATYNTGWLTGVYAAIDAPAGTYVLQNNDNKVGFYRVESGEEPTVGANRAYLTVPAAAGDVKAFFFGDDTATAIQSVFSGVAAGEIYDLSGRKLNKLQKGVNIVNGKKVMVK